MRWIIGVELRHRSTAAVQFARWLGDATEASWRDDFVGVHVLNADHLAAILRTRHFDEVLEEARAGAEEEVARQSLDGGFPRVDVVQAVTIADGLEAARATHAADGIIISRVARRDSHHLLRLGDVGRALLRRLSCPVIVVPPAFSARSAAAGPVVALTSLSAVSVPACRLAAQLAEETGRELALAHVADHAHADAWLARWTEEQELSPDSAAVLHGDLAEEGLAYADARKASLLAIGAGPLKGMRRLVGPKLACRFGAASEVPLLVVPHTWSPAVRAELPARPAAPRPGAELGELPP
jgi:nucleotide-binding universal stress UspA family protein